MKERISTNETSIQQNHKALKGDIDATRAKAEQNQAASEANKKQIQLLDEKIKSLARGAAGGGGNGNGLAGAMLEDLENAIA